MDHRRLVAAFVPFACAAFVPAQHCPDQGSEPRAATVEAGFPLGCAFAPDAPAWHLVVPPHRAVVPKAGFRQGDARAVPRFLVRYRCTGWLLLPVVLDRIAISGYVLDVEEVACPPP